LTAGERKTLPFEKETIMTTPSPDAFAPESLQDPCDIGNIVATLFGIARQHMRRDELAWLSKADEQAEIALQNLGAIASIIGFHLEGGAHGGSECPVPDLFFFLSDEMRAIRALLRVGAAAKGG
jgi:hypothetical protein